MKPPPIDESTLVFRRPGPDDADALAALYNDPAPGLMQLPYTDAAYWRQRNAQPSDGTAAQSLTLMARRTLLPELVWVPWSQARPAALRAQHRIERGQQGLHIGLQAQQGLVGHLQHTQRVLLQGQGSVTVFPLLCAQSVLPLPAQHQGNADPHNHQHGRTERNGHPCQPQGPTPSPRGHSRRGYGLTRSRRNTHSRLAGMVSVNCAVGTIRWNCAPPCGALVA